MNIDDFIELAHSRRSVRRFKPDPVPPELLEKILEAGRWAMSGDNAQPWEFVVVQDAAVRLKIAQSWFEPHKEMYAIEQTRIAELRLPPLREFATTAVFKDAPIIIVVIGDRRTYQATSLGANFLVAEGAPHATYIKNMANATHILHMAATATGLGAMWISITRMWASEIKRILDIPSTLEVHTMVALGYPAYSPKCAERRPLAGIVHYDKYDHSKLRSATDIQNFIRELRSTTEKPYQQGYMPEKEPLH
ncbi:MAG: nitroreductase family protein [Dehalococcoidia bacterium]|nr:nitroreductase family protein [Dehalococcoidia bacterium]